MQTWVEDLLRQVFVLERRVRAVKKEKKKQEKELGAFLTICMIMYDVLLFLAARVLKPLLSVPRGVSWQR